MKFVTAEEAVAVIKSKDRVFVHSVAAAPQRLIKALTERAHELRGVEVVHLHTEGEAPYARPEHAKSFHTNALFIGANVRDAVASGEADYTPVFLSEVPALFRRGILPLDVALIHVSPPDRHGYCSLGVDLLWYREARGNVESVTPAATHIPTMSREEAARFESRLQEPTGLKIVSVYRRGQS